MSETAQLFDLTAVLRAAGAGWTAAPGAPTTAERHDAAGEVTLIDAGCLEVGEPEIDVAAFVDGIQSHMTLRHIEHRPVSLAYVAAGAAGTAGTLSRVSEKLFLIGSETDRETLESLAGKAGDVALPVELIEASEPNVVANASVKLVGDAREQAEVDIANALLADNAGVSVIDGDLRARSPHRNLVGVAKTHRTRYLADETVIWGLPQGWRSPRFCIDAPGAGKRFSAYLRLHDASQREWDFGLVRVEAWDCDVLDETCAALMAHRQPPGSLDGRWDRHLAPVAFCETALRDRRPPEFTQR